MGSVNKQSRGQTAFPPKVVVVVVSEKATRGQLIREITRGKPGAPIDIGRSFLLSEVVYLRNNILRANRRDARHSFDSSLAPVAFDEDCVPRAWNSPRASDLGRGWPRAEASPTPQRKAWGTRTSPRQPGPAPAPCAAPPHELGGSGDRPRRSGLQGRDVPMPRQSPQGDDTMHHLRRIIIRCKSRRGQRLRVALRAAKASSCIAWVSKRRTVSKICAISRHFGSVISVACERV